MSVPTYVVMWSNPYWPRLIVGESLLNTTMLAFALYTSVMLMKRRRLFPKLFAIELALAALLPLVTTLWIAEETGVGLVVLFFEPGALLWLAVGGICCVLWTLYAERSAWVKSIFVCSAVSS
jgi:hypothetical protein